MSDERTRLILERIGSVEANLSGQITGVHARVGALEAKVDRNREATEAFHLDAADKMATLKERVNAAREEVNAGRIKRAGESGGIAVFLIGAWETLRHFLFVSRPPH